MDKKQAKTILDLAHDSAMAVVSANPKDDFRGLEELFDKVFFRRLADHMGNMTLTELSKLIGDD